MDTTTPESDETTQTTNSPADSEGETEGDGAAVEDGSEEDLSLDVMFEILKNGRRRKVLQYLRAADSQEQLGDLADEIAADENDTTVDAITSAQRKRVYVGLYQFHLPKMADMGIVAFDQNRGTVELEPKGRTLLEHHDETANQRRPWPMVYLAVAGLGLLTLATSVGTGRTAVATIGLGVFSVAVAALAVYQAFETRGSLVEVGPLAVLSD